MKDKFLKLRAETATLSRWRAVAHERQQTLTAFVVTAVEAAIVGRIDQAALDQRLRAIRADGNAAIESTTIEDARGHLSIMQQKIAALRGSFAR
jgi:hypothetical protein